MSLPRKRLQRFTVSVIIAATTIAMTACGSRWSSKAGAATGAKDGPISIALSNYYAGNIWRKEMVSSFENQAQAAKNAGLVSKFSVSDSNGSVPQQAQQIQSMILQGYDAIAIEAASPTALNGTIAKACAAGIIVIVFDSLTTAPCAYQVANDYVRYGELEAQYAADHLGGKGNVLMVRGIAGNSVDNDIWTGVQNVLRKYPKMKVVGQVYGQFTESVAQQATAGILPSLPHVDAVLTEGDDAGGAMKAFQQANVKALPLVIMGNTGQDLQEWQQVAKADASYKTMSISSYPSISTIALWEAINMAQGKKIPKLSYAPLLTIPEQNRDAWVKVLGYTEVANNVITRTDAQKYIDASAAGKPIKVVAPLPAST